MDDLHKSYKSDVLFPIFANRVLAKNRPEYGDYLKWLGLSAAQHDALEELARTGGLCATDSLELLNIGNTVYFDLDSYSLSSDAQSPLQRQAAWLQQYPQNTLTIEGHCDGRGTREYNLALGERRANSVANYLVALGVNKARLSTISYGKERPLCTESHESCWSQNRRGVSAINP